MKIIISIILAAVLTAGVFSQSNSIINRLASGGIYVIKCGLTTFLDLKQSDSVMTINYKLNLPNTTSPNAGVIYKYNTRYLHNYYPTGALGDNIFLGGYAGNFTMTGTGSQSSYNTAIGYMSQFSISTGSSNTSVGTSSLERLNTGNNNSALGGNSLYYNAGYSNSSALGYNSFVGYGNDNSVFGYNALYSNAGGYYNSVFGANSLNINQSGRENSAFGNKSLYYNTDRGNSGFGNNSLYNNRFGIFNSAFGDSSLYSSNSSSTNSAFGKNSLYNNTSGNYNTAFGMYSLYYNTTGDYNTAFGYNSLYNSTGFKNTALGSYTLFRNTTGTENTAAGYDAGSRNTSGNYNTVIGSETGSLITTGSNNIAIGYNSQVPIGSASNQVRIGNTSITYAGIQVPWTITSDYRLKSDIQNSKLGLKFISMLRPVSYIRNNNTDQNTEYGFIAQEVEEVLKENGVENTGMITIDDNGMYELRYNDLLAPMVKAIQELKTESDELKQRLLNIEQFVNPIGKNNIEQIIKTSSK